MQTIHTKKNPDGDGYIVYLKHPNGKEFPMLDRAGNPFVFATEADAKNAISGEGGDSLSYADFMPAVKGNPETIPLKDVMGAMSDWLEYEASVVEGAAEDLEEEGAPEDVVEAAEEQAEAMDEASEALEDAATAASETAAEVFNETGVPSDEQEAEVVSGNPLGVVEDMNASGKLKFYVVDTGTDETLSGPFNNPEDAIASMMEIGEDYPPDEFGGIPLGVLMGNPTEKASEFRHGSWFAYGPNDVIIGQGKTEEEARENAASGRLRHVPVKKVENVTSGNPVDTYWLENPTPMPPDNTFYYVGEDDTYGSVYTYVIEGTRHVIFEDELPNGANVLKYGNPVEVSEAMPTEEMPVDTETVPTPAATNDIPPKSPHPYFKEVSLFGRKFGGR